MAGTARRLLGGSALRVITLMTSVLVSFYMMPFMVHTLGDRWYGFWALAGTILGYYSILDLGLTNAAHRFLAMSHARGDRHETSQLFTTALGLFSMGGAIALALTGVTWLLVPVFVPAADVQIVRLLVMLLGVNFVIGFPVAVFHGILAANLRYDLSSYLQLGRLLVRSVLVVIALSREPSVTMLAWITLGTDVAANIATAVVAVRLWPWLRASISLFDRSRVREFFNYGVFAFLIRVGDLVRFSVDNLVIAHFLGVETVTHYAIAMRLTDSFQDLLTQSLGVLMPVFARFHGVDDRRAMYNLVRQSSRLAVALSTTVAGASIIFGGFFIRRWMGPPYLDAYLPLVTLMCAALVGVMQTPSTAYLYAVAKHKYYAWLNGGDAILNLMLSLALAPRFGMMGVALGTLIPALLIKVVLQPRYVCQQLGMPLSAYWTELGGVMARTALLQVPIAALAWYVQPESYGGIIGMALALYVVHAVILFRFTLTSDDQLVLARGFPPLLALLRSHTSDAAVKTGS